MALQSALGRILRDAADSDVVFRLDTGDTALQALVVEVMQGLPNRIFVEPDTGAGGATGPFLAQERAMTRRQRWAKRAMDIVVSGTALIALLPLLLAVALSIRLTSRGPVLFRQPRFGYAGVPFDILKFRTMKVSETDTLGSTLTCVGDPRVTPFGRLLRRTSIDELPQLINVLKGDMSLVGPRPHAMNASVGDLPYLDCHPRYTLRYRAKPGITGLAQINGMRGPTHTPDQILGRLWFDLDYVRNWSLRRDAWIVLRTLPVILGQRNAV